MNKQRTFPAVIIASLLLAVCLFPGQRPTSGVINLHTVFATATLYIPFSPKQSTIGPWNNHLTKMTVPLTDTGPFRSDPAITYT
jgi:hypothetical protein